MSALYSDIIRRVKLRAGAPDNDDRYQDADFVQFINEEIEETVYPEILRLNEEFFVVRQPLPLQDANGLAVYPNLTIPTPKRAYGRITRAIKYYDENANEGNIPNINLNDLDKFPNSTQNGSYPCGFYNIGDAFRIMANPDVFMSTLDLYFLCAQSTVIADSTACIPVNSINYDTGTTIFSFGVTSGALAAATYMTTYCPNATKMRFDLYRQSTGALIAIDLPLTLSGTTYSMDAGVYNANDLQQINTFQEGGFSGTGNSVITPTYTSDLYLLPAGISPYTTLPTVADNKLVVAVAGRYLEGLDDTEGLQVNAAQMQKTDRNIDQALGNRNIGNPKTIVNRRGVKGYMRSQWNRWGGH